MSMSVCQAHVQMEGHVKITSMATSAHVRRDMMAPIVSTVSVLLFAIYLNLHLNFGMLMKYFMSHICTFTVV
jgi:hypothetical protein